MKVRITRIEKSEHGTFGVMAMDGRAFCWTLEPEDKNNRARVSCIPEGVYYCEREKSPKFGNTFMVCGVPGRSRILFHAGNVEDNTEGCILLGSTLGKLKGKRAILNSGLTFENFMSRLEKMEGFALEIIYP